MLFDLLKKNKTSIVSLTSLFFLIIHLILNGQNGFDNIALILFIFFVLPLLVSVVEEFQGPLGIKIKLNNIEKDVEKLSNEIKSERYAERGSVYLLNNDRKNVDLSIFYFKKALEFNPRNDLARGRYAMALKAKGDIVGALMEVSKAIESGSDDETLLYNRACYKSLLKRSEEEIFVDLAAAFLRFDGFKELAKEDPDLEYTAQFFEARFKELIND